MSLPTVILPGYLAGAPDYQPLEQALQALGFPAVTVPLRRRDWFPTLGGRPVTPILAQLDQTVKQVIERFETSQVNLVGHSAGGWIARIYLGDQPYDGRIWQGRSQVATLVCLGTPHQSLERWTQRNLNFVNSTYPGAFYPEIRYVCVSGKAVCGTRSWRLGQWFTYKSYELTCGQGNCWGDGVTPITAAQLQGAENLILERVSHSPRTKGSAASLAAHCWYGSADSLAAWASYLA
jgi:pimeloyl-ACP methyl ester carboxylesterase